MKKMTMIAWLRIFIALIAFGVGVSPVAQESDLKVEGSEVVTAPVTGAIEGDNNARDEARLHSLTASDGHDSNIPASPMTPQERERLKTDCGKAKQAISRRWMDVIVYGRCDHALREDAEAWAISKLVAEVVLKNPLCITNARGGAYKISESRYLSYATCWIAGR